MTRLVWLLLASVVASSGARAAPTSRERDPARNVVQRIDVTTEPDAVVVSIVLRSPPTFTTRAVGAVDARREFIVDLSEARFERPAPVTGVANGVLQQVESSVALREGVPMARVTLVLGRGGEPPLVDAQGSTLRIRIPGTPAPEAPPPAEVVAVAAPRAPTPEPRRLVREVAFRPLPFSSAVVVRLSAPPRFEVVEASERRVTIELPNTSIGRRNDARPLDTSYFPGAVATIVSRRSGSATRIDIHLKRKTVHRERVDGDTLVIEFDHPDREP